MKLKRLVKIVLGLSLMLTACKQNVPKEELYGTWEAVELKEEGKPLNVNLEEIKLSFQAQIYVFESTLQYKEAGKYRLQSNLLLTKDTLKENVLEKGIEISRLTKDSLRLRMNELGKERLLTMKRIEN